MTDLPPSLSLLRKLGYSLDAWVKPWPEGRPEHTRPTPMDIATVPKESSFELPDLLVTTIPTNTDALASYTATLGDNQWTINTKVLISEKDVRAVSCLAARFAPPGSIVNLQADTHGAGNVFVGMIMTYGHERIPVNIVSGDIGCGLSIVPLVTQGSKHLHKRDVAGSAFHSYALATIRKNLKRGKAAEEGTRISRNITEAMRFYGAEELTQWLDDMVDILATVDIAVPGTSTATDGLTEKQTATLNYISRFAQSLGSSGNHFMELTTDEEGYYWWVVHSGSRSLGAKVYEVIAGACRLLTSGLEIATGPLASFYARAYDALNKFAKLNRILCAIAISDAMGLCIEASTLHDVMKASFLFAPAMKAVEHDAAAMLSLMSGLTHNGLKAYVSDDDKQVLFVLSKGAIAMTKRASASIVALRAGDGCFVWTMADPTCPWREQTIQEAVAKVKEQGYQSVHSTPAVVYSGHGAGRIRATMKTAAMASFEDVVAFYEEQDVAGNVAPGILGDHPRIAYNDIPTIMAHLPLHLAATKSRLATRVTYKEGIVNWPKDPIERCAEYIEKVWGTATDERKMWLDVMVCFGSSRKETMARFAEERDVIYERIAAEMQVLLTNVDKPRVITASPITITDRIAALEADPETLLDRLPAFHEFLRDEKIRMATHPVELVEIAGFYDKILLHHIARLDPTLKEKMEGLVMAVRWSDLGTKTMKWANAKSGRSQFFRKCVVVPIGALTLLVAGILSLPLFLLMRADRYLSEF